MSARARRSVFWVAILLGVANVVAYLVYTLPRSLQKKNVATRLEQLTVELGEDRSRVAALKDRAETIAANRTDSRAFLDQNVARPGASLVPILKKVEDLAKQEGLQVGTQAFQREAVAGLPLEKFAISMPVKGTYRQITGLLGQLERSTYFFTLDKVTVRQDRGGEGSIGLDIEFSAYFRAGAEAASR